MNKTIPKINKLSIKNFVPFGQVIGLEKTPKDLDKIQRFAHISIPDFQKGKAVIDILYSNKRPLIVRQFERHSNSTQTFISLNSGRFLIVVAKKIGKDLKEGIDVKHIKAFVTNGNQGITLNAGIWHCSPIPVEDSLYFAILHRSPDIDLDSQITKIKNMPELKFIVS